MENSKEIEKNEVLKSRSNPWLDYVKKVRESHPEKNYKEILQLSKETYKKVERPAKLPKKKLKTDADQ